MGSSFSQVQAPQTNQPMGKGGQPAQPSDGRPHGDFGGPNMEIPFGGINGQSDGISRPQGKGGNVTYPGQGGQPQMGRPNSYSNTVGPWDNANIQPRTQSGKGKGY